MIRKLGFIIFLGIIYLTVVSVEDKKTVAVVAKKYAEKYYVLFQKKIKNMNVEIRVNKWVYDKKS